jgi:hypothetical protein
VRAGKSVGVGGLGGVGACGWERSGREGFRHWVCKIAAWRGRAGRVVNGGGEVYKKCSILFSTVMSRMVRMSWRK